MFCDVVCGVGVESELTFAITKSGLLCQFNAKRTVTRHVELKVFICGGFAYCLFMTVSKPSKGVFHRETPNFSNQYKLIIKTKYYPLYV